jgi:hypothetical protein
LGFYPNMGIECEVLIVMKWLKWIEILEVMICDWHSWIVTCLIVTCCLYLMGMGWLSTISNGKAIYIYIKLRNWIYYPMQICATYVEKVLRWWWQIFVDKHGVKYLKAMVTMSGGNSLCLTWWTKLADIFYYNIHQHIYHNSCSDASSTEWCIMALFFQGILNIFQPSLSSHGIPSSWAISRDITRSSDSTFWFGSRPPQKDLAVCIPSFVAGILMINGFFIQCCFQIQYPFQMDRVPNSWYLHIYQWLPYYTRADNFISSWFLLPPPMFGIAG